MVLEFDVGAFILAARAGFIHEIYQQELSAGLLCIYTTNLKLKLAGQ